MLAEAELHLRRLGDAEVALRRILELAPGDVDSYLALERVLTQESKLAEAISSWSLSPGSTPTMSWFNRGRRAMTSAGCWVR